MNLRERKKLQAWRAIRTAALELYAANGYENTTVEEIAAAANVSRATFFNYFASKEAVVFDQDPAERQNWQALMNERTEEEPLWDSLTAVIMGFTESLRDRIPLQHRLKAQSPALRQSSENFGEQFRTDVHAWVSSRYGAPLGMGTALQLNLAVAATTTAYQVWRTDESFDDFLGHLECCLRQSRPSITPS